MNTINFLGLIIIIFCNGKTMTEKSIQIQSKYKNIFLTKRRLKMYI